jgi:SAM-dependent MidA family methyltransferase
MLTLPIPSNEALAHSSQLFNHIRYEVLEAGGSIGFARFMEMALYTPGLGYYCTGSQKLGKSGDFLTAPEISPLFARCIARQCQQVLELLGHGDILEIGAGSGKFACDLLAELESLDCLPEHYFILEISADLRARQQRLLEATQPHLFRRVIWLNDFPLQKINGVILANEVMDALPVTCFSIQNNTVKERRVKFSKNSFRWDNSADAPEELAQQVDIIKEKEALSDGYLSEINLLLPAWIRAVANSLNQGLVLLIDYGYARSEFYHPDRSRGTLMCHYQHHRHEDPFQLLGLQDITAHVDFTSVAENAVDAELRVSGFTTQASFLLSCGLLDLAEDNDLSPRAEFQQNQAIKIFTLPSQMGELVKVIGLTRGLDEKLLGFQMQDRRKDL